MTTSSLSSMEVINLCDGAKLGSPSDFEINPATGTISAIILPKDTGFFNFYKPESYRIPWERLQCIGEDTILVKLTPGELSACLTRPSRTSKKSTTTK